MDLKGYWSQVFGFRKLEKDKQYWKIINPESDSVDGKKNLARIMDYFNSFCLYAFDQKGI
jgi:hypothetical protein